MTEETYPGALPNNWTGGQSFTKWWRGNIIQLYTLKKPCGQCGAEMRIDVTRAALEGKAKNAGLHLKRCPKCRAETKARGTVSRPAVEGQELVHHEQPAPAVPMDVFDKAELETLRTANAVMKEELDALYVLNRDLRERLAKYELAPAMEAVANGQRMPWERER